MKYFFSLLVLISVVGSLQAQQTGTEATMRVLTLDSCQQMALRQHAQIKNARLDLAAAQETKAAAKTKYFPTLSAAAGCFRSKDYLVDFHSSESGANIDVTASYQGMNVDGNRVEQYFKEQFGYYLDNLEFDAHLQMLDHGTYAHLLLTQPVFAGGRILNGNKLAQLGIDVAELQLLMTQDEVLLNTEEKYYQVISLREKLTTLQQALRMLDTLQRDAEHATAAGVLGKNDLLKVKLKKSELLSAKLQLTNGIEMSLRALFQYIGQEYCDSMTYQLGFWDEVEGVRTLVPVSALSYPLSLSDSPKVDNRKELKLLEASVYAERLKKRMVLGEALPQIAVGATYGKADFLSNGFNSNAIVFATLSIPLTAWWETSHQVIKQHLMEQKARNNQENLRQQMELQMRQARNEVSEAFSQVELKAQAEHDAEANLNEIRNFYQAGMVGVSDFLEAQTLYRQAKNDLIDQRIAFHKKYSRYIQWE